jgi:hypothetical protein
VEDNVELSQYELVNITTEQYPKFFREVGKCSSSFHWHALCGLHSYANRRG